MITFYEYVFNADQNSKCAMILELMSWNQIGETQAHQVLQFLCEDIERIVKISGGAYNVQGLTETYKAPSGIVYHLSSFLRDAMLDYINIYFDPDFDHDVKLTPWQKFCRSKRL